MSWWVEGPGGLYVCVGGGGSMGLGKGCYWRVGEGRVCVELSRKGGQLKVM